MEWINIKDRMPTRAEPIVYCKENPNRSKNWHVGIAYWTVSEKWNPEAESICAPTGFTHWMPLPDPPYNKAFNLTKHGQMAGNLLTRRQENLKG